MAKRWLNLGAFVLGVLVSPFALDAATSSSPPIDWLTIPFVFVGGTVGILFVLGIQILRSDPKFGRLGLRVFEPISVLMLGSGIGALGVSGISGEVGPSSIVFLAIGLGLLVGVALSSFWFRARFKAAL